MHKPLPHFFFVVLTLTGFLVALEELFFDLSNFLKLWIHPSNSSKSLGNLCPTLSTQYSHTNLHSSSNLEERTWVTCIPPASSCSPTGHEPTVLKYKPKKLKWNPWTSKLVTIVTSNLTTTKLWEVISLVF